MKITDWSDVAKALFDFSSPYDDGDCDPDGEYTITRNGTASKLIMTLEWPPKKKAKKRK